ncbi:cytotoxic and regulatory T-cell molecule-like isoform X3 [Oncorhynchus keta]|uniref:cytotoxic and regulatory T-cell molecule-like isoform X3 n=1 Tax=Oncorhynchus keta TaxID=8018 RepID=UPI0015FB34EC|nr:cytotoxic and regulatory T-cell molecule-like isoform X3 [Oncorhynchus keta]
MALMLQLCFLVLFVRGSIAVQHLTVMEGETLTMKCRIRNAEGSHMEWKNPDGHVMFFNNQKVSVSDVTFKDGGLYTCLHYIHKVPVVKWVNVTVLGKPKLEITEHNGKTAIKCSAVGNGHPPKISWLLESGLEIYAQPQYLLDKNTYSSLDILHVQSYNRRVTLKCIVRHPALHNSSLMNFVKIGQNPTEESHSTTRASHWLSTGLTEVTTTVSRWHSTQVSTETPTATALNWPNTEGSPASTPDLQLSTHNWLSVSQTTENTPHNGTGHNSSNANGSFFNDTETQKGTGGSALLLIFLVTGLILGLLVVVSLFVIKLRRAHILWKKVLIITENDDSDQSVESNRSKSSNEEKQSRGRRGNGLFNIRFTKYVVEEPMATETMTTTNIKTEEEPEIQVIPQKNGATHSPQIKEREL